MPGTPGHSGRKPKPTAQKILEGNPGHRPLPKREPKPNQGQMRAPAWLKGEGRKEWRRVVGELTAVGVVVPLDQAMLAVYCQLYGEYVDGVKNKTPVSASHVTQMRGLAAEFGIVPSARARMDIPSGAPPKDEEKSEFEQFRDRRRKANQ